MAEGWVKLHRVILDSDLWQHKNAFRLFVAFLLEARFVDQTVMLGGRAVQLQRGQLISGRFKAGSDWKLTESEYRNAIKYLKTTGRVTIKTTNRGSIVTVVNYDKYQSKFLENDQQIIQQNDHLATSNAPASDQQSATLIRRGERHNGKKEITTTSGDGGGKLPLQIQRETMAEREGQARLFDELIDRGVIHTQDHAKDLHRFRVTCLDVLAGATNAGAALMARLKNTDTDWRGWHFDSSRDWGSLVDTGFSYLDPGHDSSKFDVRDAANVAQNRFETQYRQKQVTAAVHKNGHSEKLENSEFPMPVEEIPILDDGLPERLRSFRGKSNRADVNGWLPGERQEALMLHDLIYQKGWKWDRVIERFSTNTSTVAKRLKKLEAEG